VANAISCVPAGVVDVCLIPEVKFDLQGDRGLLRFVQGLLDEKGHCVVCIAEGAGQVRVSLWTALPFIGPPKQFAAST
jgi:6-phosphofructokinase